MHVLELEDIEEWRFSKCFTQIERVQTYNVNLPGNSTSLIQRCDLCNVITPQSLLQQGQGE